MTKKCWRDIPKHFPNVILDEFIVMPNHIHGIIVISDMGVGTVVETQNFASLQNKIEWHHNKFGPQSRNLASIIRGFKIGVKKYAFMNHLEFFWQARYFKHIIRNDKELDRIRQYIRNNPYQWLNDRNNIKSVF